MKKFLICLAPIVLSFLFVLSKEEFLVSLVLILIPVGSLLSGFFAAAFVTEKTKAPGWVLMLLAIAVFLIVGISYLALGVYGGCSLIGGYFS